MNRERFLFSATLLTGCLLVFLAVPAFAAPDQEAVEAVAAKPRNIVLCLDGTWNSTYDKTRRNDGSTVLKPTNVLKLCRGVEPRSAADQSEQIVYYQTGVGSLPEYPGVPNRLLHVTDKLLGGAYGAGFEVNIEAALNFLLLNHHPGDKVFIFGFSRGAATARGLTRFIDWADGLPTKNDAYYLPVLFREFVASKGEKPIQDVRDEINGAGKDKTQSDEQKQRLGKLKAVNVEYLGVWDTVMALGARFQSKGASTSSPSQSFYVDRQPARCVKHARQALAVDEARFDFRPEIWTGHGDDQRLEQRWFVGVHSNVGGGYSLDGLANLTFQWVLAGAKEHGLEVNPAFVKHYGGFPGATIYESGSPLYRALDAIRGRSGRGRRPLTGKPESANLTLDPSVIERMQIDPGKLGGKAYRPENVLQFLACQPDLDQYLKDLDVEDQTLPPDVLKRIGALRPRCGKPGKA